MAERLRREFKNRIFIEHFFGMIKRWKRVRNRIDGNINTYKACWYIAISLAPKALGLAPVAQWPTNDLQKISYIELKGFLFVHCPKKCMR